MSQYTQYTQYIAIMFDHTADFALFHCWIRAMPM